MKGSAVAESVDLAAIAFGGATGATVTDGEGGLELVAFGRGRALVEVALDGDRRTDPLGDQALHDDDPLPAPDQRLDPVPDRDSGRRLDRLAVHGDVPAPNGFRCVTSGLREPDGVKPLVDTNGFDRASVG